MLQTFHRVQWKGLRCPKVESISCWRSARLHSGQKCGIDNHFWMEELIIWWQLTALSTSVWTCSVNWWSVIPIESSHLPNQWPTTVKPTGEVTPFQIRIAGGRENVHCQMLQKVVLRVLCCLTLYRCFDKNRKGAVFLERIFSCEFWTSYCKQMKFIQSNKRGKFHCTGNIHEEKNPFIFWVGFKARKLLSER